MEVERVCRIVGGAHKGHIGAGNQVFRAERRVSQLFVAQIPHGFGCVRRENAVIAEIPFQLQMSPVVQGVPDGPGQRFRKSLELHPVGGTAGDFLLRYAVGANQPPFVVVAAQPDLGDIVKPPVLRNVPGVDMAVIIHNGHFFRPAVIQPPGRFVLQQKFLIQKRFHASTSSPKGFLSVYQLF